MPELEPSLVPVTVAVSHLRSCAAELARTSAVELGELEALLPDLVAAQRQLSVALSGLAGRVAEGQAGALAAAPAPELTALTEILHAAASAFGYSADALAESEPLARSLADFAGRDTHL